VAAGHSRHAPFPSQNPSVPQVEAAVLGHPADGPMGTALHLPTLPEFAHDWQAPVQAMSQQKPCAQIPVTHSVPSPHDWPLALSPQSPVVPLHTFGAVQSAAVVAAVQLALHTEVPHLYAPQETAGGVVQAPLPSQVEAAVDWFVATLHVGSLHPVPRAYFWHTPPWHLPVVPHDAGPMSLQTPAGSGLPVGVLLHVPTVPISAHDWHEPLQAELQHTPWAQKLDWHSVAAEHEAPIGFLPHWLAVHTRGDWQLASAEQDMKHADPLQT
jgi:hypothetical protein